MVGRRRWRTALLVVVAVVVAAVPALVLRNVADAGQSTAALATSTIAPPPTSIAPLQAATPLLSARRLPGTVTGQLTTTSLLKGVERVGAATPAPSCLYVTLDGSPFYELRADTPLIPASNQKLITASVALEVLGPDHRFTTTAVGPAPGGGGVVAGDLTVVGGGDPLLTTQPYLDWLAKAGKETVEPRTSYEALADAIVASGVRVVTGSVVGQEGRYDTVRRVPTWPPNYRPSLEGGPLSSLLVDDGFVSFAPPVSAPDPAQHAAAVMTKLLRARGVEIAGAPRSGSAPAGATELARVVSPPLTDVVRELLTTSDNNTAELLLKEIGVVRGGAGSTAAGAAVVAQTLAAWGLPTDGLVIVDGSGLDRGNRVTCRQLVTVLDRGGEAVRAGLAVAGETGTLADVLRTSPVKGKLRGKTGTLTGVKSLTATMPLPDHRIDLAYVVNAPNAAQVAVSQWERLGSALASFPDRPVLAPFLPLPPVSRPTAAAATTAVATTGP